MKKLFAVLLALVMVFALAAPVASADDAVSITLWTYPIGGWGNSDTVDALIAGFEAANPGIKVTVDGKTASTVEDTFIKPQLMGTSATAAGLCTWIPLIDLNEILAAVIKLVLEHV